MMVDKQHGATKSQQTAYEQVTASSSSDTGAVCNFLLVGRCGRRFVGGNVTGSKYVTPSDTVEARRFNVQPLAALGRHVQLHNEIPSNPSRFAHGQVYFASTYTGSSQPLSPLLTLSSYVHRDVVVTIVMVTVLPTTWGSFTIWLEYTLLNVL